MPFVGDFYSEASDRGIIEREQSLGYDEEAMVIASSINLNNSGVVDYTHKDLTLLHDAVGTTDFAEEFIYNKIWITLLIDFEFIVEVETDYIAIWNSYLDQTATITDFNDPGHSGISIDTISTPVVLATNEEKVYTVTVTPQGPAEQYTEYSFIIDGGTYSTLVIGKRVLPFPFPANWNDRVNIDYGYETSIYSAPTTHEQRRSVVNSVRRELTCSCLVTGLQAQAFENLYRKGAYRYFGVPVYPEAFTTNTTITGQTSIVANEDLTYMYNLQNYCTQVVIVDHTNLTAEIKLIESVAGQTVTFDIEVENTFTPANTTIYPIFIGMLRSYNFKNITDRVVRANVSFVEKFVG